VATASAWLWTIGLNGLIGWAGYLLARHAFGQRVGWPRVLASVILAWAWVTLGMEILGSLGLLARVPLLVWSVFGLGVGLGFAAWKRRSENAAFSGALPGDEVPRTDWEWGATASLAGLFWASALLGVATLLIPVKVVSDGPIYHLYFAVRWWKAGRLFLIATPFGENAATYFPAVGDLWFTWLLTSWGSERLAKLGQAPFLLIAAQTAYALALRLGAGRTAAVIAACWFASSTPLLLYSFEANVDTIFVAGYLLAAYFFLRFALKDDGWPALALGGIAAGGALGTKTIGIVFVPVLLILAALAAVIRPGSIREKAGRLLFLAVTPAVMAGYWYGRNAILTGNPLYPMHLAVGGRVLLSGWYEPKVMRFSRYYLPVQEWRALVDTLLAVIDPRLASVWLLALLGGWSWGWRRVRNPWSAWIWLISVLAILNVALYWLVIPYRTQQRFMLQALGLGVAPLALLFQRGRLLRGAATVLLFVHLLTAQVWPAVDPFKESQREPPWDLTILIPNRVSPPISVMGDIRQIQVAGWRPDVTGRLLVTLAIGCGALAAAWTWGRVARKPTGFRRCLAWAMSSVLVALVITAIFPRGAAPPQLFYPASFPDYLAGWYNLERYSGVSGARVAYAGTDIPYYLFGSGLRNEVMYINVDAHRDWLLHDYHAEARRRGSSTWPNPRPGWDRIHPDYDAWLANLRAARIKMLVVARAKPEEGLHNIADPQKFPIERQWAESHPETFEPLYGVYENEPEFRLYRVRPPQAGFNP
jgi:hypothetical protein